jgi:hypothetical protein
MNDAVAAAEFARVSDGRAALIAALVESIRRNRTFDFCSGNVRAGHRYVVSE